MKIRRENKQKMYDADYGTIAHSSMYSYVFNSCIIISIGLFLVAKATMTTRARTHTEYQLDLHFYLSETYSNVFVPP